MHTNKTDLIDLQAVEITQLKFIIEQKNNQIAKFERLLEWDYPRDIFQELIRTNSPYAFYIFQWVPYQTDAKQWRLKMLHDVKTFDGREAFGIWPNGSSCGPFKDHEVEFIRISKNQFGEDYQDPRDNTPPSTPKGE